MTIGERVRAARIHLGWTQARLAKEAGVSPKTVFNFENGVHEPDESTVQKLTQILGPSMTADDPLTTVRKARAIVQTSLDALAWAEEKLTTTTAA